MLNAAQVHEFLSAIEPFFYRKSITYVDVGAHKGDLFREIIENGPRVQRAYLIEPNPASFAELESNVGALDCAERTTCLNRAVSDRPGTLSLRDADTMTHVLASNRGSAEGGLPGRTFEAEAITLDALVGELERPHISLLKIDVEGHEAEVIAGAQGLLAGQIADMIYIEAGMNPEGNQQTYYRRIEDALGVHGYRLFRIFEQKHEWLEDSPLLRRVNLAFMSPRFAAAHPYKLCTKLLALQKETEALKRDRENAQRTEAARLQAAQAELTELRTEKEAIERDRDAEMKALLAKADALGRERDTEIAEREAANKGLRAAEAEIRRLREEAERLRKEHDTEKATRRAQGERLREAEAELVNMHSYGRRLEARYTAVLESETWRAMEPVRQVMRLLKGRKAPAPFVPRFTAESVPASSPKKGSRKRRVRRIAGSPAAEGKREIDPREAQQAAEVKRFQHHLWGGLSRSAVRELERVVKDPAYAAGSRFEAAHTLATWYAFDGDLDLALSAIRRIDDVAPAYGATPVRLLKEGFIHLKRGDKREARRAFERLLAQPKQRNNPDAILGLANCLPDELERLGQINRVFARAGHVGIARIDPTRPLALDNVRGHPAACEIPDLGKVSVIMPTFEAEASIRTAIRSLQEQTYRNLEIIVVDDCSSDATHAVAVAMAEVDPRIVPLRQERNGGAYAARNRGLAVATGDFITTHDSDDWSHPQKIERQLASLAQTQSVMGVCTHWVRVTPGLDITSNWRISDRIIHWSHSSFLMRRAALDRLGPWDPVRVGADTELIWRLQAAYGKDAFRKIDPKVPLAFAMDGESSLTRMKQTHVRTVYFGLRQIYRAVAQHSHLRSGGTDPDAAGRRQAALPAALAGRMEAPLELNLLLFGDCCDPAIIGEMAAFLDEPSTEGRRVGVFHWPDLSAKPAPLCAEYASLLLDRGVIPVPPQTEVALATGLGICFGDCTVEPDGLPVFQRTCDEAALKFRPDKASP